MVKKNETPVNETPAVEIPAVETETKKTRNRRAKSEIQAEREKEFSAIKRAFSDPAPEGRLTADDIPDTDEGAAIVEARTNILRARIAYDENELNSFSAMKAERKAKALALAARYTNKRIPKPADVTHGAKL